MGLLVFSCDRVCTGCPFVGFCDLAGGGGVYFCGGEFGCRVTDSSLDYVGGCGVCDFRVYCWDLSCDVVCGLLDWLRNVGPVSVRGIKLPKIVPIVSLLDRDIAGFWWDCGVEAVIVSFTDFLRSNVLDEVVKRDVHWLLGFDGLVLLSSVMPDRFLFRGDVLELFMRVALAGGFDGVIGWDVPVYVDMPLYISWINLVKGLELTYRLSELDIPVVALVKGNTLNQIKFSLDALQHMGFKNYALHASEYLMRFRFDARSRNILYKYAEEMNSRVNDLLVIGALRPSSLKFICDVFRGVERLSVGGLSYYLDAKRFKLYLDGRVVNVSRKYLKCSCPSCVKVGSQKILEEVKSRVSHNLNQLKSMFDGSSYSYELYDLIVEEGETAVIASDIHIWTPESKFENFIKFLYEMKPKHLILLGDVFDFKFGSPSYYELELFFNTLRDIKCSIHLVEGCSDGDSSSFLKVMDQLVFEEVAPPLTYKKLPEDLEKARIRNRVLLDFYKFYRQARKELLIQLPGNIRMKLLHGHQLVMNPKENMKIVKEVMLEYKSSSEVDWLIIGHIHRAFIDYDDGLASTGCWQLPLIHLRGTVSKNDLYGE